MPRVTYHSPSHPRGNMFRKINLIWEIQVTIKLAVQQRPVLAGPAARTAPAAAGMSIAVARVDPARTWTYNVAGCPAAPANGNGIPRLENHSVRRTHSQRRCQRGRTIGVS